MEEEKKTRITLALVLLACAAAIFAQPFQFLTRFGQMPIPPEAAVSSLYGVGAGYTVLAVALLFECRKNAAYWIPFLLVSLAAFAFQTHHLSDWWIDDAGITFSYSRSLAEGHGLTFQPDHVAEEGYSSTLWMLILAFSAKLGFDIPTVAKFLGIFFGGAALALAITVIRSQTGQFLAAAVAFAVITTAPFAIWSASGQEHALQALVLMMAALLLGRRGSYRWGIFWLAVFVFIRPEAPIIVAACFFTATAISLKSGQGLDLPSNLPIALVPFFAFVGLIVFRVAYFGDPLPNPYYTKTSGVGTLALLNPFGPGWSYVLAFLTTSAAAIVVPFLVNKPSESHRHDYAFLSTVLIGHMFFVVWSKGDWMGQFRFIMPVLPIFGILIASGFAASSMTARRGITSTLIVVILTTNTLFALNAFKAEPTTPLSVVSEIGRDFAKFARRIGIANPVLAHHDAGAIAYERSIRLIDLGGLVSREIAKNMQNAAFLEKYVLIDGKPDFVFGAHNFAAQSGFLQSDTFAREYIPLTFVDQPHLSSHYTHIRRDRVVEKPGIELRRDERGNVVEMIVEP